MIRAVVVDDEPLARRRLRAMLAEHADVTVVAECATVAEAADAVTDDEPDLVLLDVELGHGTGFDVLAAATRGDGRDGDPLAVVFVTGHVEHAARAFDVAAVDYLVKPFGRERLAEALDRVRARLPRPAEDDRPDRLAVDVGRRIRLVPHGEIDYLRADGNYVRVHAGAATYALRESLGRVLERLDARAFLRVHRSFAVRVDRVVEVQVLPHGELALTLVGGQVVVSGRRYRDRVRAALGMPARD